MRASDVEEGIGNCALAWVVWGESFRDLSEGEAIAARNAQARRREALERAEIPGVVFEPPERATAAFRMEMQLALETSIGFRLLNSPAPQPMNG